MPAKGGHHTEEARAKIGLASKKRWAQTEYRVRMLPILQRAGSLPLSEQAKQNISRGHRGRRYKCWSERARQHVSVLRQGTRTGVANPAWRGGTADFPYCSGWRTIRRRILKAAGIRCEECGSEQDLLVHHQDGDKQNCCEANLLVLCRSCHSIRHWREVRAT